MRGRRERKGEGGEGGRNERKKVGKNRLGIMKGRTGEEIREGQLREGKGRGVGETKKGKM